MQKRRGESGRFGTDSVSVVLMEEERLQLNLEEFVPDSGQETRAGAAQLGVCKTSARSRQILIRFNSSTQLLLACENNGIQGLDGFMTAGSGFHLEDKVEELL